MYNIQKTFRMKNFLTKVIQYSFSISVSLYFGLIYLAVLFFYRIAFFLYNGTGKEKTNVLEIIKAFVLGLRFDLSSVAIILIPVVVFIFAGNFQSIARFRKLLLFFPQTILCWMILHLTADILYYENSNKHLGYEGIVFLGWDFGVIFRSALSSDIFFILAALLVLSAVFFHVVKYAGRLVKIGGISTGKETTISVSYNALFILILLIFARGGFQPSPISPGNAVFSKNSFLNNLALNGVFTVFADLRWKRSPNIQKMKIEEAAILVRNEIAYEGSEFVSVRYPVLRKTLKKSGVEPPNIILVILESWTGKFINSRLSEFQEKEITPNFNKLIRGGVFFRNFFSTGGRTSNGLFATLTGIPDRPGFSVIHSQNALGDVGGIGAILKSGGYDTLFLYGGELAFENIKPLVAHWGFDTLYDMDDMTSSGEYRKGIWGYDDADLFDFLNKKLTHRDKTKPFFATALTVSTHYPYKVPDKKFELFTGSGKEKDFLNTLYYSDWAIGNFLEKAKKSDYFDNTVFIFVADHTHHRGLNYFEDRNIPFLVYAKNKFKPALREDFASQLDIIPTILGMTGKELYFSAMGKDLFSAKKNNFAYFAYGNIFGWVEGDVFFLDAVDKSNALHFSSGPPYEEKDLCKIAPLPCLLPQKKARAFLNLSENLLEKNLVFPSSLILKKDDF